VRRYQLEVVNNPRWDPADYILVWPIAQANNGILASNKTALDTPNAENNLEPNSKTVEIPLDLIAKVYNFSKCGTVANTYPLHSRHLILITTK
jgi:hypothetical protein